MIDKKDILFMRRALDLARKGWATTSPNPMVGAVIVKGNKILAEGWHRKAGEDHSEIVALKKLKLVPRGTSLYVTLEPCHHFGRTPPCVDAVLKAGIKEVVIGMKDPNPKTCGKSIQKLRRAGVKVRVGVMEKECQELNEAFVKFMKSGMPFVVAKTAQTLDGKIATFSGDSKWITSAKTREVTHLWRNGFDAILVGINTVLKDDPRLNPSPQQKILKKIILDSHLRIPLKAKLFKDITPGQCVVVTTQKANPTKVGLLTKQGVDVILAPSQEEKINLKWLFKELAQRKIMSILIEGGAQVVGSALKDGLVDKMWIFIAPKVFGDLRAKSSIEGLKLINVDSALRLEKVNVQKINEDVFINGYVYRNR